MSVRQWLKDTQAEQLEEMLNWALDGSPDPSPSILKMKTVERYLLKSGYKNFVETGTHEGVTTEFIASLDIKTETVELSEEFYLKSSDRLKHYDNIKFHLGDSAEIIKKILSDTFEPTVFWLDGHYSGGETALGARVSPILEEIHEIFLHRISSHIILIDDIRLFDGQSYPSIVNITEMQKYFWPNSYSVVRNDILRITPNNISI